MNPLRPLLSLATVLLAAGTTLSAQVNPVAVTVRTTHPNATFTVDGQPYQGFASFSWAQGSKHQLGIPVNLTGYQVEGSQDVRYAFSGWSDGTSVLNTGSRDVTITVDPNVANYYATFGREFKLRLNFGDPRAVPGGVSAQCVNPGNAPVNFTVAGVIKVGGICYWADMETWVAENSTVPVEAYPYPGFVFLGWGLYAGGTDAFARSFTVSAPTTLRPSFAPGKRVTFLTEPLGYDVLVDGHVVPTSSTLPCSDEQRMAPWAPMNISALCIGEFDFLPGTAHVFGAPSPQRDRFGNPWVFQRWANGSGQDARYVTGPANVPETWTAKFVRGVSVGVQSEPQGLNIFVDGQLVTEKFFLWGIGEKHQVEAPGEAVDGRGRKYVFKGWANGGPAAQEVTILDEHLATGGFRMIARFEVLNRAVLQTNVPGLKLIVDGQECTAPCTVDGPAGKQVTVRAPESVPVSEVSRYEFAGAQREWTVTLDRDDQVISAPYRLTNKLITITDPAGGAEVQTDPVSADGFYPADATVGLKAGAKPGFKFRRWAGDLDGTSETGWVNMASPRVVRVLLDRVPYIAPAGVRNAAGETPEPGVAAGSLVAIVGQSLATHYEAGPASPLAQTIAGVVVQLGERLLPLVHVSPEQINALLPSDVPEGEHELAVKNSGFPDVNGKFTVVRNAPGLFNNQVDGKSWLVASHENGTPITAESPAKRGEQITILGTGFGPYDRRVVDGFAQPAQPQVNLVDAVEIVSGEQRFSPVWTGAAAGHAGVTGLRWRIPRELPSGAVSVAVSVNGKLSNTALLAVE